MGSSAMQNLLDAGCHHGAGHGAAGRWHESSSQLSVTIR